MKLGIHLVREYKRKKLVYRKRSVADILQKDIRNVRSAPGREWNVRKIGLTAKWRMVASVYEKGWTSLAREHGLNCA